MRPFAIAALFLSLFAFPLQAAEAVAPQPPRAVQLENPLEPLEPKSRRTEAERDRLRAAAMLAAGRMLEKQGEEQAALRKYQRAYRYSSDGAMILREIVPLAFSLGHSEEAVRYALIAVEKTPTDPILMRRLALLLIEQGEWERAVGLYGHLVRAIDDSPKKKESVEIHLEAGRLYFLTEQPAKAADHFAAVEAALENPKQYGLAKSDRKSLLGNEPLTWYMFGAAYLEAGRLDRAEDAFEKSHAAKPDAGLLGYRRALVEAKRDRPGEALEQLERYFDEKLASEAEKPYELFVELIEKTAGAEEVTGRLEALHADDPKNEALASFLANRYLENDEFEQAEAVLLPLTAGPAQQAGLTAHRGLIEVYHRADKPDQLLDSLTATAAKTGTLEVVGEPFRKVAADAELVDHILEIAQNRRKSGEDRPVGEALAASQLAIAADRFDAAGEFYELAIKDQPGRASELLLSWGLELFVAEQAAAAVAVFQRGIDEKKFSEDNPAYTYYLAGALELNGQTDEALAAARKAVAIRPDSPEFASRAAWILYHAKRYDEALAAYQTLIEKFDEDRSSETRKTLREARLAVSNLYVLKSEVARAEEWLEQVLDEFPQDVGALNDLGYLWVDQNKHLERALRMIERAVAAEPDNVAYRDSLGWAYYRLGRYQDAVAELEKAASGEKPDPVILDHLAAAYEKLGKQDLARATWQRALVGFENEKDEKQAEQVRKRLAEQGK